MKLRVAGVLITAVLAWPAAAAPGDAEKALQLLRDEAYDDAIRVYRRIVADEPDNPRAHYDLAAALGFLRRYPEATEPIEEAIRLAPDRLVYYAAASIIHANNQDLARAFEASLQAARMGEPTAMFELVWLYRDGRGVDADPDKARYWAEQAAAAGHVAAMDLLVNAYLNGELGAAIDTDRAGRWALSAWRARRGSP